MNEPKRRRRGKGEGAIAKVVGRELWWARISVSASGKRIRKVVYGKTRKEVAEKLTRLQTQRLDGTLTVGSVPTVAEYLTRWLQDTARLTVRDRTHRNYTQNLTKYVIPIVGGIKLDRLAPAHVQAISANMEAQGKSPRTRQLVHSILRRALSQAVKWGMLPRNVCDSVERPRVPRHEMQALTPSRVSTLLEAVKEDRLEALYVLAVTAGMRQGELLGLEWSDLDLQAGTVSVRRSLYHLDGEFRTCEPKSEKSRRMIQLPRLAVAALERRRKSSLVEGLAGSKLVFTHVDGSPIKGAWLLRVHFRGVLFDAGLPVIRFHDLRHTAATLLLREGVHPKIVQERLGHSTIQLTMDVYSHVLPSLQEDAATRLDNLLKSAALG